MRSTWVEKAIFGGASRETRVTEPTPKKASLEFVIDIATDMRAWVALDKLGMLAFDEREQLLQLLICRHVDAEPTRPLAVDERQFLPERGGFRLRNLDLDIQYPHLVVDGDDLVDSRRQQHCLAPLEQRLPHAGGGLNVGAGVGEGLAKLLLR